MRIYRSRHPLPEPWGRERSTARGGRCCVAGDEISVKSARPTASVFIVKRPGRPLVGHADRRRLCGYSRYAEGCPDVRASVGHSAAVASKGHKARMKAMCKHTPEQAPTRSKRPQEMSRGAVGAVSGGHVLDDVVVSALFRERGVSPSSAAMAGSAVQRDSSGTEVEASPSGRGHGQPFRVA